MILPDALERFGPLSEAIQVKGAIALARIARNDMHLDVDRLEGLRARLEKNLAGQVDELVREPRFEGLLRLDRDEQIILTEKGQAPSLSQTRLCELLEQAANDVAEDTGRPVRIPRTGKGNVSRKAEDWEELAPLDPLVHAWIELGRTTKMLQFFRNLAGPVVRPGYTPLVRTGRTSCSNPNIQNLPRNGGLREAFVASPGHLLLIADYGFIELRTLAAECEARYGSSRLAEVIREGVDPHAYAAAMFEHISLDEFMALKTSGREEDRDRYDTLRHRPGGPPGDPRGRGRRLPVPGHDHPLPGRRHALTVRTLAGRRVPAGRGPSGVAEGRRLGIRALHRRVPGDRAIPGSAGRGPRRGGRDAGPLADRLRVRIAPLARVPARDGRRARGWAAGQAGRADLVPAGGDAFRAVRDAESERDARASSRPWRRGPGGRRRD